MTIGTSSLGRYLAGAFSVGETDQANITTGPDYSIVGWRRVEDAMTERGSVIVTDRIKSGGTLRQEGNSRYAVIRDQGHHRGFRIDVFEDGGSTPV
jgi:hypothetical protein